MYCKMNARRRPEKTNELGREVESWLPSEQSETA